MKANKFNSKELIVKVKSKHKKVLKDIRNMIKEIEERINNLEHDMGKE